MNIGSETAMPSLRSNILIQSHIESNIHTNGKRRDAQTYSVFFLQLFPILLKHLCVKLKDQQHRLPWSDEEEIKKKKENDETFWKYFIKVSSYSITVRIGHNVYRQNDNQGSKKELSSEEFYV